MDNGPTAELFRGSSVRLAAPSADDADYLAATSSNWSERLGSIHPVVPQSTEDVKERIERGRSDSARFQFTIRTLEDDELVGQCALSSVEWASGTAWLGIGIPDPERWGRGYGREAIELLLDFGFMELNLHRIALGVFSYNERAISLYRSIGFVHEGTERERLQRAGERFDNLIFGMLRHEWETRRA